MCKTPRNNCSWCQQVQKKPRVLTSQSLFTPKKKEKQQGKNMCFKNVLVKLGALYVTIGVFALPDTYSADILKMSVKA